MGVIQKQSADPASPAWSYPGVPLAEYRTDASAGITKQVLVGETQGASDFIVRYFTVPPGGTTALDQHKHQHGVVLVQGKGRVLLGSEWHDIGVGDAVFTDTDEVHQFAAVGAEPLGFICVIPRWAEADSCALPLK